MNLIFSHTALAALIAELFLCWSRIVKMHEVQPLMTSCVVFLWVAVHIVFVCWQASVALERSRCPPHRCQPQVENIAHRFDDVLAG